MPGAGQKIAGGAKIGNTRSANNAATPLPRCYPVGDFTAVVAFARRPETVARTKTGARAAHIDHDQCIPSRRSEEHTSELQSLMRIPYAVFRLKKKTDMYIQYTIWPE